MRTLHTLVVSLLAATLFATIGATNPPPPAAMVGACIYKASNNADGAIERIENRTAAAEKTIAALLAKGDKIGAAKEAAAANAKIASYYKAGRNLITKDTRACIAQILKYHGSKHARSVVDPVLAHIARIRAAWESAKRDIKAALK